MAEKTVEQRCYEALKARGVTFAAAESCTGGLIAKRITDVPGASGVFMGGIVSIGFSSPKETIAERFDFGAASREEIRGEAADEAFKLLEEKLKEA